jgi:DNA-binding NarL/FixJ family response regulator
VIRVVIADDHAVVRAGLRAILEREGIAVVGEADDGSKAFELATTLSPDVVLMDLQMPGVDGIAATARLRAAAPAIAVLVLTTYDTEADVARAIDAGASGFLLKDLAPDRLVEAVRATARGETVLAPSVAGVLLKRITKGSPSTPARAASPLTARELDVLTHVARGSTNRAIAKALRVSEATVKTHLLNVFEKLDVDDRTAAVTRALREGWIRLE